MTISKEVGARMSVALTRSTNAFTDSNRRVGPSIGLTLALHNHDIAAWTRRVEELKAVDGVDHLELWMESLPDATQIKQIRRLVEGIPCTAHAPFVDISLVAQDEDIAKASLKKLTKFVGICHELCVQAVAVHPGKYAVYEDKGTALRRLAERYDQLLSCSLGLPIGLENLKHSMSGVSRNVISQVQDILFFRSIYPAATFTLDIGHAVQNELDFPSLTKALMGTVPLIHLHDAIRGGSSHRSLGSGDADLEAISAMIRLLTPSFVTLELLNADDEANSLKRLRGLLGGITSDLSLPAW